MWSRSNAVWKMAAVLGGPALYTACSSATETNDAHRAIADTMASSVQIFTERETGGRRAASAVVLGESSNTHDWLIITAAHTFEPLVEQSIRVVVPPGRITADATLIATDSDRDLALLKAAIEEVEPVRFSQEAYLVDPIWVVAFPWGRDRTVVNGAVSQIYDLDEDRVRNGLHGPVKLIDASVSYGMSGGGVFDSRTGRLLGLVRGYRTALVSLPDRADPLRIPVAGETTVVSSFEILCFLSEVDTAEFEWAQYSLPSPLSAEQCPEKTK